MESALQARNQVWKMRDPDAENDLHEFTKSGDEPLYMLAGSDSGLIEGEAVTEFKTFNWLGGSHDANSKAALVAGTWDHRQLTSFSSQPGSPHIGEMGRALNMSDGMVETINFIASIVVMDFNNLPNQDEIDDAGEQADAAQEEADGAMAEIDKNIDRVKAELAKLKEELAELEAEKKALEDEKDVLEGELADLQAQKNAIKPPDTVPQSLLDAIAAKQNEIAAKQAEIDAVKVKIGKKKDEIKAKEDELEAWEDGKDQANGETAGLPGGTP